MSRVGWVAVAALAGAAAGVGIAALYFGAESDGPKDAVSEWLAKEEQLNGSSTPTGIGVSAAAAPTATQVAPVQSLLAGLEARLAETPGDAKGWALLAQSYAFVGNRAGAETAIEHAVALGFDEQELRDRVALASREPAASGDWIEQMIGVERR